jgi:hypothetical protein
MFVISVLMQIAAILATVGFISFIELGVQRAQPFLVGGSEDTWGFGQILAMLVLILPTVERLEWNVLNMDLISRRKTNQRVS